MSSNLIDRQAALEQPDAPGTGYVGIEDDYPVSIKQVLNITAETGALITQERVRKLPRYKMQEPCKDAVSRQAAIDALDKRFDSIPMEQTTEILLLRKDLRELPSAQQKPLKYTGESICLYCQTVNCDGCVYEPMEGVK